MKAPANLIWGASNGKGGRLELENTLDITFIDTQALPVVGCCNQK